MSESPADVAVPLTKKEKIILFFLPNVGDIIFIFFLQIPLFLRPSFLFGDGSTGWHLVAGDFILQTHQIPYHDLFSYTHPDAPWVAYEWLSDLLMAFAVKLGGLNLLAVCCGCSIGWLLILLYGRCRKEGAHVLLALLLVVIGTLVTAVHWLARPHLFTFFGIYLFTTRLEDYYRGEIGKLQLLIPLTLFMLLWVNTHPAFLFGFALMGIYLFSSLVVSWFQFFGSGAPVAPGMEKISNHRRERVKWIALSMVACGAATLVNPYGTHLYSYIAQYLKGNSVLAATDEFLSPVFHGTLQPVCLELLFGAFIVGLAMGVNRLTLPRLLTCLAFGHLVLSAVRNMPLYAIVILPAISLLLAKVAWPSFAGSSQLVAKWRAGSRGFDENESMCNSHIWPMAIFVFLSIASLNGGKLFGADVISCSWGHKDKPSATLEYLSKEEAAKRLDPNHGFNYDNWGGYIRYRLGTRVFIDDRADFYGENFYTRYSVISLVQPGWKKLLDEYKVQWILMPKNSRLGAALADEPDWHKASSDDASALFVRNSP